MIETLTNLFYPKPIYCPLCSKEMKRGNVICQGCLKQIEPWYKAEKCQKCGKFLRPTREKKATLLCGDCIKEKPNFDIARAVCPFEGLLKEAIYSFKYTGIRSLAYPLASLMAEVILSDKALKELLVKKQPFVIVPVPLADEREEKRGFNQSRLLSLELGNILGLSVYAKDLVKTKNTLSQAKLVKYGRIENLKDAFKLHNCKNMQGKNILLVDDIFTTGSTTKECTKILKGGGAEAIFVITVATGFWEE